MGRKTRNLVIAFAVLVVMLLPTVALADYPKPGEPSGTSHIYLPQLGGKSIAIPLSNMATVTVSGTLYGSTFDTAGNPVSLASQTVKLTYVVWGAPDPVTGISTGTVYTYKTAVTGSTGGFSFAVPPHNRGWYVEYAGGTVKGVAYRATTEHFSTLEPDPGAPNAPTMTTANPTAATSTVTVTWTAPVPSNYVERYDVYINGTLFKTLPASARSVSFTPTTGFLLAGFNTVEVRSGNCSASVAGTPVTVRWGYSDETVAADLGEALAYAATLQAKWLYLDNWVVQVGDTPNGYQAVSYPSSGRTVISKSHTASISTLLNHELWHIIDYRDGDTNGDGNVYDWGERVAPANSASYLR